MGGGGLRHGRGAEGKPVSPNAAKRREERGCMGVVAGGPQLSSGIPGKHDRRKQDFQTPVQNREDRNPAPWPLEPRRALCGKAPDRRWASPAPGSRGKKGKPASEERGRGGGSGATYGSGGEGGNGGPSAGPGRRGRTAEAPRLRRAGLRWAPSWSAPRARPPRRQSPCIIDDSRPPRAAARAPAAGPPARSAPAPTPVAPPPPRPRPTPGPPARAARPRPAAHLPLQDAPARPQRAAPPARALAGSQAGVPAPPRPDPGRGSRAPAGGAAPERLASVPGPASPTPPRRRAGGAPGGATGLGRGTTAGRLPAPRS
ncbi:translation initiation factor IF-2-like [Zalophus californianus]|uniref:Translation initiation factor IF-2-like n=1 Tax=Zalophus californianus TaxID=9704 RepID=A0A6P9FDD3_ZALCA|nr:translation initiation factor IF-2-like [Zalophus californianus]